VFAAEHFGLPYWPHSSRIEFSRLFPNFFDKTTRLELYTRVADAFKATVEDVFDDAVEQVAFIPPFATLALARCEKAADLVYQILALRDEYATLRAGFAQLEGERRSAVTIKDRIRARRQQKLLLDDIGKQFDSPALVKLEAVVRYVPNVIRPAMQPTDPTRYSADLITMPIELLAQWWRRRPISKLFELAERLQHISAYEVLLRKVFGQDISLKERRMSY
jgi:hypothetical protein